MARPRKSEAEKLVSISFRVPATIAEKIKVRAEARGVDPSDVGRDQLAKSFDTDPLTPEEISAASTIRGARLPAKRANRTGRRSKSVGSAAVLAFRRLGDPRKGCGEEGIRTPIEGQTPAGSPPTSDPSSAAA